MTVQCGEFEADMPYYNGYYAKLGDFMIRGRTKGTNITLCINYGIFADTIGVQTGDAATISMKEAAMLLEALMGASLEELQQDYMISYYHYFGITKISDSEKYDAILNNNLMDFLYDMTGAEDSEALQQMD